MKTEWDYTNLADAYLRRPDYAPSAIQELLIRAGVKQGEIGRASCRERV